MTRQEAKIFYEKLKVKVYGGDGTDNFAQVKLSPNMIATYMDISVDEAVAYCDAIVRHKLSEWEGTMLVI